VHHTSFPCGCEFEIIGFQPDGTPLVKFDMHRIRHDCEATWDLICAGFTKGLWQIESNLGKHWTKEIKPRSLDHLSAVIALVRPGCLKAMMNGKSLTKHFSDRKNGLEEITYLHPVLEPILKNTFGILTYQEQAMAIVVATAKFTLMEADQLRKAAGKKLAEEMAKVKTMYLEKAKTAGVVDEKTAGEIFDWIEKSQRYSFNRSHSICYAELGYWSAYAKLHFPQQFYASWLNGAKDKIDPYEEVSDLVSDAKVRDVPIFPPDFKTTEITFHLHENGVRFGIGNIKNVGGAAVTKIIDGIENVMKPRCGEPETWTWYDFLTEFSNHVTSTVIKNLILAGGLSSFRYPRTAMLFEFDKWQDLTEKEQLWIQNQRPKFSTLRDALESCQKPKKEGGGCANKNRSAKLADLILSMDTPPYALEDRPDKVASDEEQLLGASLTFSQIDACDTRRATCTCREFVEGKDGYLVLGVEIARMRVYHTKSGKEPGRPMGFLIVKDATASIDNCVVFPDTYAEFESNLVEGNTVLIQVERDKTRDSLVIKKVWPAV